MKQRKYTKAFKEELVQYNLQELKIFLLENTNKLAYNMIMELAESHYLWLMPQKETYDEFQKIIQNLSKTYGTCIFEPHVTLVSGLSGKEALLIEKIAFSYTWYRPPKRYRMPPHAAVTSR